MLNKISKINLIKGIVAISVSVMVLSAFCIPVQANAAETLNGKDLVCTNAESTSCQIDNGTLISSAWYGLGTEGEAWYKHCATWQGKYRRTTDTNKYNYKWDFTSPAINRGKANVTVSDLSMECEVWEPVFKNKVCINWHCKINEKPKKGSIYVKPRLAIYDKQTNKVSFYEESGNGVKISREDGNHYVRINKSEYLKDMSTGSKDMLDDMINEACNKKKYDRYVAIVENITVIVVLENV